MICFRRQRPLLQIGSILVNAEDDAWLRHGLLEAAQHSGQDLTPLVDLLMSGVEHFLEHDCSLQVLPLPEFIERFCHMLSQIGLDKTANALPRIAPPVTLDLESYAHQFPFELLFFQKLYHECLTLKTLGVRKIQFSGLSQAVLLLAHKKRWSARCESLKKELLHFLLALQDKTAASELVKSA